MVDCWECDIRMEFSGDAAYCIDSRDHEQHDPYWLELSLEKKDEICYFADNAVEIEDNSDNFCWFRAKT